MICNWCSGGGGSCLTGRTAWHQWPVSSLRTRAVTETSSDDTSLLGLADDKNCLHCRFIRNIRPLLPHHHLLLAWTHQCVIGDSEVGSCHPVKRLTTLSPPGQICWSTEGGWSNCGTKDVHCSPELPQTGRSWCFSVSDDILAPQCFSVSDDILALTEVDMSEASSGPAAAVLMKHN